MSAAVILQHKSLVAKATPQKADMKTRKGVVRGRTPKARQTKPRSSKRPQNEWDTEYSADHCEEETEAGGRIPSFPQTAPGARATRPQAGNGEEMRQT